VTDIPQGAYAQYRFSHTLRTRKLELTGLHYGAVLGDCTMGKELQSSTDLSCAGKAHWS